MTPTEQIGAWLRERREFAAKSDTQAYFDDCADTQAPLLAALEQAVEALDYQHSDINKCAGRLEDEACFACDTLSDIASILGGSP